MWFFVFFWFLLLPDLKFGYFGIQYMNRMNQIQKQTLNLNDLNNDDPDYGFAYGIMSRYTPLSSVGQVGKIGPLDSNYLHYHTAIGKNSNKVNFVYYAQVTEEQITMYVKFKDNTSQEHIYPIQIDKNEYENVWFYFQLILWPKRGECKILLIQYPNVILQLTINKCPYLETYVDLIFGGGLEAYYDNTLHKFSYFPGEMRLYSLDQDFFPYDWDYSIEPINNIYYYGFNCILNYQYNKVLTSKTFQGVDKFTFTSENPYTNFFTLAGWIKINEIISDDETFIFKALKITSNLLNEQLIDDNLSPFCLFYQISESGNKLIITTYSYTFPTINIDFAKNPFLMTYEIDFLQNIYSWIYLSIMLRDNHLTVSIDFQDNSNQLLFIPVNLFHQVTFQIQIGNLEEQRKNYLNFQAHSFEFANCEYYEPFQKICHYSCSVCDGPTSSDCLACWDQDYIYKPSLKKCVCPYNQIQKSGCQSIEEMNLQIIESINNNFICPYGYFQVDQKCFACPTIIGEYQIYCLECLLNPTKWVNIMYCGDQLIAKNGKNFQPTINPLWQYYIFDGEGVTYCLLCETPCLDDDCLFSDYLTAIEPKISLQIDIPKILCPTYCRRCYLAEDRKRRICALCDLLHVLINQVCVYFLDITYQGKCFDNCAYCEPYSISCFYCNKPYYLTHERNQCKLCTIKHCKQCFEYNANDVTQNTLLKDFFIFEAYESLKIGCSLCDEGYHFDFTLGNCIYRIPSLTNCLRYFVNFFGEEICVLSSDNFSISPQTTNCQNYIKQCQQCILLAKQLIKCMICSEGYAVSAATGQCQLCEINFALTCVNGDFRYIDSWTPLLQSFLMQLLQDFYIYPMSWAADPYQLTLATECIEGYRPTKKGKCAKYCTSDCQECTEFGSDFICVKCPNNEYGNSNLSSDQGSCLTCPKLCALCQTRSADEIQKINPYFIINDLNIIYTYKCYKTQSDDNIQIDQEQQVAKYCFNNDCSRTFQFYFLVWPGWVTQLFKLDDNQFYENFIDTEFCNQMGIKEFLLILNCQQAEVFRSYQITITTTLKQKIFTLQFVRIEIIGISLSFGFTLEQFDSIKMQQYCFASEYIIFNCNLYFYNLDKPIDLTLYDSQFEATTDYVTDLRIILHVNRNLLLKNILFIRLNLKDTTWLNYYSLKDEEYIEIDEITFTECIFEKVTLFTFYQYAAKIKISKLTISYSYISSSILINFFQQSTLNEQVTIDTIIIEKSTIVGSTLILNQLSKFIQISNIFIINNTLLDSKLFETSLSVTMSDLHIENNIFNSTRLFVSVAEQNLAKEIYLTFSDSFIVNNQFYNSSILNIQQNDKEQTSVFIKIFNFTHDSLFGMDKQDSQIYLFDIQCYNLLINNFTIKESSKLQNFKIQYSQVIEISNVAYYNNQQIYQIFTNLNCATKQDNFATLIHIQGFSYLNFTNIKIANLYSNDFPFIQINSDFLYKHQNIETILINNVTCIGNILLKTQLGNILSMLAIFSELVQSIHINQLIFEENFFHQYVDDPSQTAAGLLFISSLQSTVNIKSFYCNSNGLTNSSYSFITINALTQSIQDFQIINGNILDNNIWAQYYNVEQINPNFMINLIIQNIFKIQNKGGGCKIQSSEISVINGSFKNLLSLSISVFDITTQGYGIVNLINITVKNATVLLSDNVQVLGSITIYALTSLLHATFTNISIENVHNRLGAAVFSITPSLKQNYISINNLSVIDCFSFMNQLIDVSFSQQSLNQNRFQINNLIIAFSQHGWNDYITKINIPTPNEITYIKSENNALIHIQGCSVILTNIRISGILISPILIVTDFSDLLISNFILNNIQVIYPFRLLQFYQSLQIKHKLIIQQLTASNITQLVVNDSKNFKPSLLHQQITDIRDCKVYILEQKTIDTNVSILNLTTSFNQNYEIKGALIFLYGLSQFSKVKIQSVSFINNNCNFCYEGIFQLQLKTYGQLTMENLVCQKNFIRQYGCLLLNMMQQETTPKAIIKISNFFTNNGTSGTGIYINNLLYKLHNSRFIKNSASEKGGAIFTDNITNDFLINQTVITSNLANLGGGIYMSGTSHMTTINFIQSLLAFNKATQLSDNLVESPDHLVVSINNNEMNFLNEINQGNLVQVLSLKPYRIIIQGYSKETNILYLSSGSQISSYQYYDTKYEKFTDYITEFSVVFKNSLNEKIVGGAEDMCSLQQRTLNLTDNSEISEFSLINSINYDSEKVSFILGNITLRFDPYSQDTKLLQLQIACKSENKEQSFYYRFYVKTFMCQLGEYLSNSGCETCQPSQGFYSVTYNTTQCSIFDETKLKNITSNRIQLKSGYWRPNQFSNIINLCYKNQQYCIGGWSVNDDLCISGHLGGLCEECDTYNVRGDGNFFKLSNSSCEICNTSFFALLPFIFVSLWSFVTIFLTLISNQSTKETFSRLKATTKLYQIIFKLNQGIQFKYIDFESIFLKMFLNNLWIFSIIFTFNIKFDFQFNAIQQISNPNTSMATNLDCFLYYSTNFQLVYARIIAMITFILAQILLVLFGQLAFSKFKQISFDYSVLTNTAIYLYVSNQAALIKHLGSLAAIRTISGIDYVQGDVKLLYFDSTHLQWMLFLIVPCLGIIGVAIPLALFLILIKNRDKFNETNFRKHLGYLFNEYTNRNQFWEQIKILERFIIIIIVTSFETNIYYKVSLLSFTILSYLALMELRKPYIIKSLQKIDIESGFLILVAMFLAQVKYICEQDDNQAFSQILQIIILTLCVRLSYCFLSRILQLYIKKYKQKALFLFMNLFYKFGQSSKFTHNLQRIYQENNRKSQQLAQNLETVRRWRKNVNTELIRDNVRSNQSFKRFIRSDNLVSQASQRITSLS